MIRRIINSRSKTITFSAGLIAFSVGISAILGLLRDRLLVSYFNVSELDIYFAAFAIPDFVYGIIITGGVIAAFLPVFSRSIEKNEEDGWNLANNTLNILLLVLLSLCFLLFLFAPYLVKIIAPGFSEDLLNATVILTRIMLISPVLLGASSLFSGILQYFDRFLAYSLAPIFYNVGIIFGILFFTPYFGIVGLAYGVIFGSVLHLFIQLPIAYFSGFKYRPILNLKQKEIKRIFYLIIPRIVGQASTKINVIIITALASTLAAGSISVFNLANHLQAFPVRVIGVAFAVAAFPAFSKSIATENKEKFLSNFSRVICQVLFLIIPISILVFLLRAQIVRLVLGAEGFGWRETQLTAASLGIFSFSFFAAAFVQILVRAFFSFQDTRTPVFASIISMVTSISLSFLFIWLLGFDNIIRNTISQILKLETIGSIEVIAFPIAILVSTVLHFTLLIYLLKSKVGNFKNLGIKSCLLNTILSSLLMGILTFLSLRIFGSFVALDTFFAILIQTTLAITVATLTYIITSKMLKSQELLEIKEAFLNR